MNEASNPTHSQGKALRRLFAPILQAHGYAGDDASRTLDELIAALTVTVDVLDACCKDPAQRDGERDILACLLAAAVRAHDRVASDRLHALLSLSETIARLLRFAEEQENSPEP
jgi:hypothetical protein